MVTSPSEMISFYHETTPPLTPLLFTQLSDFLEFHTPKTFKMQVKMSAKLHMKLALIFYWFRAICDEIT
jgi:hypothetical protein